MNKNINKSCRYCITAFAAVTDRKLSLQGSVSSWKWGVSGMLVIWDHVFSNSTNFSIVCSENCSCPCTPQVGAEALIQGQRSLQNSPSTSLVGWHQALSQLWKPVRQLDSTWSSGDERSGMAWAEGTALEGRTFPLVKNLAVEGTGCLSATI